MDPDIHDSKPSSDGNQEDEMNVSNVEDQLKDEDGQKALEQM